MVTKLFWIQLVFAGIIGVFHLIALHYALYWHFVWLDVPVHFAGGVWAAFASLWILRDVFRYNVRGLYSLFLILAMVLAIGMTWEVFEMFNGTPQEANYFFDTKLDLIMDVFGGLFAWGIMRLYNTM